MAFDYFANKDQEEQGGAQGQPARQLGQESPVISTSQTQQGGGDAEKKSSSGSFTNLNSYLDANKDRKFGQEVAGKVQGQVDEANQAQDTAETGFKTKANEGSVDTDQDTLNSLRSNPTSVANDSAKLAGFEKMRDASYKGPNALTDDQELYSGAQTKTDKAATTANQTSTENGRKAYLQQEYGSGKGRYDYTPGQQRLDNLLIQNDPGSREAFANVQNNAGAASQRFTDLNSALQGYAAQRKSATDAARTAARGAVGIDEAGNWLPTDETQGNAGAMQDELENLDRTVAGQKNTLATDRAALEAAYGKGNLNELSPEALQRLGITPQQAGAGFDLRPSNIPGSRYDQYYTPYVLQGGSTVGLDPRNFIDLKSDADLNRSTVADADTQARIAALSKLAGKDNSFITPEGAGSMAGKPLYTARGSELASSAAQRQQAMQGELQQALQHFTDVENQGGIVDVGKIREAGNVIRAKYGLPPV